MLKVSTNDRKTKADASSKTVEQLPEQKQALQLMGETGRSRQAHPLQQREKLAALQKVYGNQAVLRMKGRSPVANPLQGGVLQRKCACGNSAGSSGSCAECQSKQEGVLQTKLQIGEAGDRYEQEADRVADQVMAAPVHSAINGVLPSIKRFRGQATRQTDNRAAPASIERALSSPGRPLDLAIQQDMEQRFRYDFSNVRIHTDETAEQSARDVSANAYTVKHNVVFGAGQYAPETQKGRRLIAHELTHVVQQTGRMQTAANRLDVVQHEGDGSDDAILQQQQSSNETVSKLSGTAGLVQRQATTSNPQGSQQMDNPCSLDKIWGFWDATKELLCATGCSLNPFADEKCSDKCSEKYGVWSAITKCQKEHPPKKSLADTIWEETP